MEITLPNSFIIDKHIFDGNYINKLFKSTVLDYEHLDEDLTILDHIRSKLLIALQDNNLILMNSYIEHLTILSNNINDRNDVKRYFEKNRISASDCLNYIDDDDFMDEIGEDRCVEYFDIESAEEIINESDLFRDSFKRLDTLKLVHSAIENDLQNNDMVGLKYTLNWFGSELNCYGDYLKYI